jgi:hypothetical protein
LTGAQILEAVQFEEMLKQVPARKVLDSAKNFLDRPQLVCTEQGMSAELIRMKLLVVVAPDTICNAQLLLQHGLPGAVTFARHP